MSRLIELNDLNVDNFIELLRDSNILIYENIQGTKVFIEYNHGTEEFILRVKSVNSTPINKIDLASGILQKGKSRYELQNLYFETVLKNIETYNKFNVFGHLDFVTRYGGSSFSGMDLNEHWDIITKILKTLVLKGKGIEINTSGYRYKENRVYPEFKILKKYLELGGKIITIGSDAHIKEHIFMDMDKAYDILEKLGVKYITTFDKMKPVFKKIK